MHAYSRHINNNYINLDALAHDWGKTIPELAEHLSVSVAVLRKWDRHEYCDIQRENDITRKLQYAYDQMIEDGLQ